MFLKIMLVKQEVSKTTLQAIERVENENERSKLISCDGGNGGGWGEPVG